MLKPPYSKEIEEALQRGSEALRAAIPIWERTVRLNEETRRIREAMRNKQKEGR